MATRVESLDSLSGLSQSRPALAAALAIFMFSLAGIPPLFGFWPKLMVFQAAVDQGLIALAVAGIVGTVVGAYYYLKIVKIMYFDPPGEPFAKADAPVETAVDRSGGDHRLAARLSPDRSARHADRQRRERALLTRIRFVDTIDSTNRALLADAERGRGRLAGRAEPERGQGPPRPPLAVADRQFPRQHACHAAPGRPACADACRWPAAWR